MVDRGRHRGIEGSIDDGREREERESESERLSKESEQGDKGKSGPGEVQAGNGSLGAATCSNDIGLGKPF
jgi:hypothetical protein